MKSNLTLETFRLLSQEVKNDLLNYHTRALFKSDDYFSVDISNVQGTLIKEFDEVIQSLMSRSNFLYIQDNSWATSENEAFNENKKNNQSNFRVFFNGFSSAIASIKTLNFLQNKMPLLFNYDEMLTKINVIKENYELQYKNFHIFNIQDKRIKEYSLIIPSLEEINQKAEQIYNISTNIKFINLLDPLYRDYITSISVSPDTPNFRINNTYVDNKYDQQIVDIDNALSDSYELPINFISSLYKTYLIAFKNFQFRLLNDMSIKTVEQYKSYRVNSLKSVYRTYEEDKLNQELNKLTDSYLLKEYNNSKNKNMSGGLSVKKFLDELFQILCSISGQTTNNKIFFNINNNKVITSEFNDYKFFAIPDISCLGVSSEAYFGFSIPTNKLDFIQKIENQINDDMNKVRNLVENLNDIDIKGSNFYSPLSMIEEINSKYQSYFFNNTNNHQTIEFREI